MISWVEWNLVFLLPLLAGGALAIATQRWRDRRVSLGVMAATLSLSYLGNLLAQEYSIEGNSLDWLGALSLAGQEFLWPKQAIGWVPVGVWTYLIFGILCSRLFFPANGSLDGLAPRADQQPRPGFSIGEWIQKVGFSLICGTGVLLLLLRMLWTSVYFSDRHTSLYQFLLLAIPTVFVVVVAAVSVSSPFNAQRQPSRVGLLATMALVLSTSLLLATQGTVSLAKLSATAGMALSVPTVAGWVRLTRHQRLVVEQRFRNTITIPDVILVGLLAAWVPLLLGHLFAEVSVNSVVVCGISWLALAACWPDRAQPWYQKWGVVAVLLTPTIGMTVNSVQNFQSEVSESMGYGQYSGLDSSYPDSDSSVRPLRSLSNGPSFPSGAE